MSKNRPYVRKVEIKEHENKKKFPHGIKKIVGSRQLMDDSLRFGINDFEYKLIHKVLQDPFMNATRAFAELHPNSTMSYVYTGAAKVMNKEPVRAYFNHCLNERLKIGVVSEKEILFNLKLVALRCMEGIEVFDSEGKSTGEWRFEPNSAIRAWELLGKHIGMFREKVEITGSGGGPIRVINEDMSIKDATQAYAANLKRRTQE